MSEFPPTPEQQNAIDLFGTKQNLRLIAYAGAGKTSTLVTMAKTAQRRATYMAFNKAIAAEAAAKFPGHVQARTAHSLAYRAVLQLGMSHDKMRTAVNGRTLQGERLNLETTGTLSVDVVKQLLLATIRRFCQSGDMNLAKQHVWRPKKPLEDDEWWEQREIVWRAACELWTRMADPRSTTPLGHDGYLKLWQLTQPTINADVIYVDEAQDLNPVLIALIAAQQHCQIVSVGDSHQQIYAWRGAVDALQQLPGIECRLTQSFRFGANIAEFGNKLLRAMGETVPLRGNGRTDDCVTAPDAVTDAILCRTNSGVIRNAISCLDSGWQVYIPGGAAQLQAMVEDAARLQDGHSARTADLLGFNTWQEVTQYSELEEGSDLKSFVSLVDRYGCKELRRVLGMVRAAPCADSVAVTTAHKAKGLEWNEVELNDDFAVDGDKIGDEERRLFYVAATRAKTILSVDPKLAASYMVPK